MQKCSNLIEKSVLVVNRQSSFLLLRAEYEFDYNEQYFIVVFYLSTTINNNIWLGHLVLFQCL